MPNALAKETSPYLLQHANNPVNWMPWGEEAFAKAKKEDKLVFLSIGYSTCHWCHVMEHESFENEEIAAVMNKHFINIKVDREERPDIDATYMAFVQATTGQGGWPLNVWLTPDALPVVGGTYFPPKDKYGRPGFPNICEQLGKAYREDKEKVLESAKNVMEHLRKQANESQALRGLPSEKVFGDYLDRCESMFDPEQGGFGDAPKFPRPTLMLALMQLHERFPKGSDESEMASDMSTDTLRAIAKGGIHDHLGGGFHRYSVDRYWHVPHYEKMLYDQGQLALAFTEAWQITEDDLFRQTTEDILAYLLTEMLDTNGAFHSAEDADSLRKEGDTEKHEGAYWTWTSEEISSLLDPKAASIFSIAFGVQAEGNSRPESDPHGELEGQNTLFRALQNDKLAAAFDLSEKEIAASLASSSKILLTHRATRPKPHRDDKIITAWNGLAIAALAKAAAVFSSEKYASAAATAAHFIKDHLWKDGLLFRSYRGKPGDAPGFPADYSFLIFGLIDLHAIDPSGGWLEWATELQTTLDKEYWSEEKLGYVVTTEMNGKALLTIREDYDGAEPSPNHIAALNLLKLAVLAESEDYAKRAEALLRAGANTLEKQVFAAPVLLAAHDLNNRGVIHFQIPQNDYSGTLSRLTSTHRPRAIFDSHAGTDILLCEGQSCRIFEE
ncbi:MAG: thioredoxin domain-containing protein [Akkermansiaceae bacterium]|nr:thioredoxin domain-containing protein [Akkermansiaceae bacterium]